MDKVSQQTQPDTIPNSSSCRVIRISVQSCPDQTSPITALYRKSASVTTCTNQDAIASANSSSVSTLHPPGFWNSLCDPHWNKSDSGKVDAGFLEAQSYERFHLRRNALAHPLSAPRIPQETRERIQEDVNIRKGSLTRKISQYFKAKVNADSYEVDLI